MVGGADFIKTGDASEKEGLGDAVIGDIIIVCAQVLVMIIAMIVMIAMVAMMVMVAMVMMVVESTGSASLAEASPDLFLSGILPPSLLVSTNVY